MRTIQTAAPLDDLGKLLLRAALALLLLFHGMAKVTHGIDFIVNIVTRHGIPGPVAYLVYLGEVAAPLLILFGVWTRIAALVAAADMIVAVLLTQTSHFFTINNTGGWALELEALYLIAAIVIALQGAGRYSIAGAAGRWN